MFEMITLHPFIEGNKRTGLMCADTLMVLNYGVITASDRQRKNVALRLAKNIMTRQNLIKWLRKNHVHMPSTKKRMELNIRLTEERYRSVKRYKKTRMVKK